MTPQIATLRQYIQLFVDEITETELHALPFSTVGRLARWWGNEIEQIVSTEEYALALHFLRYRNGKGESLLLGVISHNKYPHNYLELRFDLDGFFVKRFYRSGRVIERVSDPVEEISLDCNPSSPLAFASLRELIAQALLKAVSEQLSKRHPEAAEAGRKAGTKTRVAFAPNAQHAMSDREAAALTTAQE